MTTNDLFAALPTGDEINKVVLRNALVRRVAYIFADSENPGEFIANQDGNIPYCLGYNGRYFWLDIDDSITGPGDNTTLIVTADSYRYFSDGAIDAVWFLKSQNDTAPPVSPTIGDAYHTAAAPTGDWAGYPNMAAVWTRRGWIFQNIQRGRPILVIDENAYYHMNASDVFTLGLGSASVGAASIRDTMIFGGARTYLVENQTTNAPPSLTPGTGSSYYVVGGSATGAWVGQSGKIAVSYDGLSWTFITPTEGMQVYDRALNARYDYNGGWGSAAGAWTVVKDAFTVSGSTTVDSSASIYGYAVGTANTPPTTAQLRFVDDVTLAHAAHRTGTRLLRFTYSAAVITIVGVDRSDEEVTVALFRDSDLNAIAWMPVLMTTDGATGLNGVPASCNVSFMVDVSDLSSHTYQVAIMYSGGSGTANRTITSLTRRTFQVEEKF